MHSWEVIIYCPENYADFLEWKMKALVSVLKMFRKAIGWIIANIVGIPLIFALIKSRWLSTIRQVCYDPHFGT